jgi:peptide/nickel transport system substrate-binding protein
MWSKALNVKMLLAIAFAVAFVGGLACAAEEASDPVAPKAAAQAAPAAVAEFPSGMAAPAPLAPGPGAPQLPAPAAPSAPAAMPKAPEEPAEVAAPAQAAPARMAPSTTRAAPTVVQGSQYVARSQPAGYAWEYGAEVSPRPTTFNENPVFAEMVKAKTPWWNGDPLPPLAKRLPVAEDVYVFPPPDEIGIYGGDARVVGYNLFVKMMSGLGGTGSCMQTEGDGVRFYPLVCKSVTLSEDGRVYTATLRQGHKWSDGVPFTMRDVEFAWSEDLNYNKELNPNFYGPSTDSITGKPIQFAKVDDQTFTLSFDNPNYTWMEAGRLRTGQGCTSSSGCMFEPFHYSKKFHPKYAVPAEHQKLMDQGGHKDWTKLWKDQNIRGHVRYTANIPVMNTFFLSNGGKDDFEEVSANPFYHGVDPAGNQLPYLNKYGFFKVENRDTAIFRSMAGETDGPYTTNSLPAEIPLYIANAEKGDYSLGQWPETSGNDAGFQINPEYNVDPFKGEMFRTQAFREALSLGLDRNEINEVAFLGIGVPQAWVPHPVTAFYPGDEWRFHAAIRDVPRAKELLASVGLVDTDGDGIVNRPDNGKNFELHEEVRDNFMTIAELRQSQWADIGIKFDFKADRNRGFGNALTPTHMRAMPQMTNPWLWTQMLPYRDRGVMSAMGAYFESIGTRGMSPVGAPKTECKICSENEYRPLSPVGNYPADPDGFLMAMQDLYRDGKAYPMLHPERIKRGKEIYRLNVVNTHHLGTVGFTGNDLGLVFKRNNFRNVPNLHQRAHWGYGSMLWYFEDGLDNRNNPGNRSKKYRSTSFFECHNIASDKC